MGLVFTAVIDSLRQSSRCILRSLSPLPALRDTDADGPSVQVEAGCVEHASEVNAIRITIVQGAHADVEQVTRFRLKQIWADFSDFWSENYWKSLEITGNQ